MSDALDTCQTVADQAHRNGPPSLERVALEIKGLGGLIAGRAELVQSVLERTVRAVDATTSLNATATSAPLTRQRYTRVGAASSR